MGLGPGKDSFKDMLLLHALVGERSSKGTSKLLLLQSTTPPNYVSIVDRRLHNAKWKVTISGKFYIRVL
jgi:hypothetical protein